MKTIIGAYKHLQEQRARDISNKAICNWWDNLHITEQQRLFWNLKGKKNIHVEQFINDHDKYRLYKQEFNIE